MKWLTLGRPGLLTTVQDCGRWGFQDRGVPVCGAMDVYSHRLANRLVGNDPCEATLEVTLTGPELQFEAETTVAVTGAEFELRLNGTSVPLNDPIVAPAGSSLRFGERRRGARSYVAIAGGLAVPRVLGSRSTHQASAMGGFAGRALRAGDRLPIGEQTTGIGNRESGVDQVRIPRDSRLPTPDSRRLCLPDGGARLRVLPGPHVERFETGAVEMLASSRYRISPESDRMGYRLEGTPVIGQKAQELISCAMPVGGLQIPSTGQPILLMADHATTGGYPVLGVVISADLPIAGQLAPGDWVEFELCSLDVADAALRAQEAMLSGA